MRIDPSAVILVTGGSGSLGWSLAQRLAPHCRVLASYCSHACVPEGTEPVRIDLAAPGEVEGIVERYRPAAVIHLAAVTNPDTCEQDPETALRVNCEATSEIAHAARRWGCKLVLASTDLVFDGARGAYTEDDTACPLSTYGVTKLKAERAALGVCPDCFVFRSSLIYGFGSPVSRTFLSDILKRLSRGELMQLYTDQRRNPIFVDDLTGAVVTAIENDLSGLYHIGGAAVVTRYEFGKSVCQAFGLDPALLVPIRMKDFPNVAARPLDSTLDFTRFTQVTGFVPTDLDETLAALACL